MCELWSRWTKRVWFWTSSSKLTWSLPQKRRWPFHLYVCVASWIGTAKCGSDLSSLKPCSTPPLHALTQHAHLLQTVWFSQTNGCRMLLPLLWIWCCPVRAGACFSSSGWRWMRTAELVTSGSPLSSGAALWWTPEWKFPQRRARTKLSWGALFLTCIINTG